MFNRRAPVDTGLQQIAEWQSWFLSAHAQRLADMAMTPAQRADDLMTVTAQAAAIAARMKDDYLSRRQR